MPQAQLTKWGNSLAVRIPKQTLEQAKLAEGDRVEMVVVEPGTISIKAPRRKPTLRQMVAQITPENMHAETDWGGPVGREAW